jgi:glycine oxidase
MTDAVIIGGGIVGCACAYELTKAGTRVTLLEYGKTGMQATNAAAGMLAPIIECDAPGPMLRWGMQALAQYPAIAAELEALAGFDVEFRRTGILKVALDGDDIAKLQRRHAWQRELGLPVEWLDAATCRELEPRISERIAGGIYSETEGSVSNQLLALAFERAAIAREATFRRRSPVLGFEAKDGRIIAARTPDGSVAGDVFVLAAGARSGQIAATLRPHTEVPVHPVRGQMIALGGMSAPISRVVWGPGGYLVPRANGLVFAGATVENVGFRRRTTQAGIRGVRANAIALVPQLKAATEHFEWAGLRPGSRDGLPIIGRVPGWENLVAATGHYRNGILLGPITGAAVARGIAAGDWSAVPEEFAAARFAPA